MAETVTVDRLQKMSLRARNIDPSQFSALFVADVCKTSGEAADLITTLQARVGELEAYVTRLTSERDSLLEALNFYATAWESHPGDSGPGGNDPQEAVCEPSEALLEDCGHIARKARSARDAVEGKK